MNMTHYMELLSVNQPWNLLIFMAVPIVLAETIAVTELYILYTREYKGSVRALNRACSIVVGIYFTGVFFYLLAFAVIPITAASAWRGPGDMIAVGFYLLGIVPLLGLTLVDLNVIGRERDLHGKMAIHAGFVALFLIVGHIAMIFGMLD
ncbi:MAG: DUF6803 family protein, partial [Pseudolabrys sp.]